MLSSTTDKVIGILGDRLEPLPNQYDCDSDYPSMYYEFYHSYLFSTVDVGIFYYYFITFRC